MRYFRKEERGDKGVLAGRLVAYVTLVQASCTCGWEGPQRELWHESALLPHEDYRDHEQDVTQ